MSSTSPSGSRSGVKPVDDGTLARALTCALNAYEAARAANSAGCDSTWFDVLTVTAFRIFADAGVSWAVIEVGLGGRKDSTNIVFGEVAVITNVELEHTEVLGSTREAIAADKVGILKAGATLVTTLGPDEPAGRVVHDQAERLGCPSRACSSNLDRGDDRGLQRRHRPIGFSCVGPTRRADAGSGRDPCRQLAT